MIAEFHVFGLLVPSLLAWALPALLLEVPLRRLLARAGVYRLVWHPPLFDAALYLILLGGVVALADRIAR